MTTPRELYRSNKSKNDFYDKTPYNHDTEKGLGEKNITDPTWPYETFLLYRIDKSEKRGLDATTEDLIYPGETHPIKLISAAINYINDEIWYTEYPDALTLIRYAKTLELARMAADVVHANILEHCNAKTPQWIELEKQAIPATHMLMDFTDDWLSEQIHWRPFSEMHETDEILTKRLSAPFTNKNVESLNIPKKTNGITLVNKNKKTERPLSWKRFVDAKTMKIAT